jgi:galactokinase
MGSGVSSSAALEMAFGVIYRKLGDLGVSNADLAWIGKDCENKFVGVNSGIMDQMASAMGKEGCAMFLDTRSMDLQYAPLPDDLAIVLCDTKKERSLAGSAYNERRSQCEAACREMGITALRDATSELLELNRPTLSDVVYRRARHVISENGRVVCFKRALEESDEGEIGRLMRASHESLRDDYEVSCAELDIMAAAAWSAPGCVGARMTGAGFGGACVALVKKPEVDRFIASTISKYDQASGRKGEAMACMAADGAHIL